MEQRYSEASSRSATQENPHILWDLTVHYRVQKFTPSDLVLSHTK